MANIYGMLRADRGRTTATRTGSRNMTAVIRTWSGSVSLQIVATEGGYVVTVKAAPGSTAEPHRTIAEWNLADIVSGGEQ